MKGELRESVPGRHRFVAVCLALIALTSVAYWSVCRNGFVHFDDNVYITENPHVLNGLNLTDIKWAFSTGYSGYSHPITWLSHQLDYSIYGPWAGGHHLTSVVIHILNTILLFFLGWRLTRRFLPSALLAAFFAVHPLHVESVAWVAERKDVLSGFFFFLTLHAYVSYASRSTVWRYLLVLVLFVMAILSKPMVVTLPFVLLLLDYWPLGRLKPGKVKNLLFEKVPFLVVAAIWSAVTFVLQKDYGILVAGDHLGTSARLGNALVSYVSYLWTTLWPVNLAAFYSYRADLFSGWPAVLAAVLLLALTAGAWVFRKGKPYLLVGWFWFLGMLVPVIGLAQVGSQARADRYMYLPQIGLCLAVIWALADWAIGSVHRQRLLGAAAAATLLLLGWRTSVQCGYWRNTEAFWNHAIAVTRDNGVAHRMFGNYLLDNGQLDDAMPHFQEALKIFARSGVYDFGAAFAHDGLGNTLVGKGRINEAIPHYEEALRLKPDYAIGEFNWGIALSRADRVDEAIAHWKRAVTLDPTLANAYVSLANALLRKQAFTEAMSDYEKSLQLDPNSPFILNSYAWALATAPSDFRKADRAIQLAQRAGEITRGENPVSIRTLAAAYAANGQFDEAITTAERALRLLKAKPNRAIEDELHSDIGLYQLRLPVR